MAPTLARAQWGSMYMIIPELAGRGRGDLVLAAPHMLSMLSIGNLNCGFKCTVLLDTLTLQSIDCIVPTGSKALDNMPDAIDGVQLPPMILRSMQEHPRMLRESSAMFF